MRKETTVRQAFTHIRRNLHPVAAKRFAFHISRSGVWLCLLAFLSLAQIDYSQLNIEELKKFSSSSSRGSDVSALSNQLLPGMYKEIPFGGDLKNSLRRKDPFTQLTEIDQSIDDSLYVVGPNDELTIYLWGSIDKEIVASVNQEGLLVIPSIGTLEVNGMKLVEVKREVEKILREKYKSVSMTIALSQVRRFKAYIIGSVVNPGVYVMTGASRVADLVSAAGGLKVVPATKTNYSAPGQDSTQIRLRGIEIANDRHPSRTADLAAFYHSNDMQGNPYLCEGDRVFVSPMKEFVSIYGEINYPGTYDFIEGDSFESLLKAAGGLTRGADTAKITITRFVDDLDSLLQYSFPMSKALNFPLQRDDRILVCGIPEYRVHRAVEIRGEVEQPGIYPIQKERTRLKDVIAMAGGLNEDAFLPGSSIQRRRFSLSRDLEFERLKATPIQVLTPLERSYLKTKLTEEEGRISIDFDELYKSNADYYNIILEDSDVITIAPRDLSVYVTGAVVSPGLVGYKKNAKFDYYIQQAGGFNMRARKYSVMVIKGGTGIWLRPSEAKTIEAGDRIWIPEKEYHNWFQSTRDILAMTGAVATIVISYITIRNNFGGSSN
jgi:protein involved in polysaccharide export with SLBB domain